MLHATGMASVDDSRGPAPLAACDLDPRDPATVLYVTVPSASASNFTSLLATMLKERSVRGDRAID
jgi:hypothetical protein